MAIESAVKRVIISRRPGELWGLGVAIDVDPKGLNVALVTVCSIAEGSPSANTKDLQIGDEIVAVDGEFLIGKTRPTCLRLFHRDGDQTELLIKLPSAQPLKVEDQINDDSNGHQSNTHGDPLMISVEIHQRKDEADR